ncbi:MAG: carboxypeptidase regulatory-like domain-containing protein [Acidobacteriia bacterium]|nr:carboxypeptidase regulatory-like domain-containing protein [Terriglobia bacterium]
MNRTMKWAASALLAFSVAGLAQGPTAEISGAAQDPSGAVLAGVVVTVTNPATNTQRTSTTNAAGTYSLPALPPGVYNMKAELTGFSAQTRNGIELQVGQVARIDISL